MRHPRKIYTRLIQLVMAIVLSSTAFAQTNERNTFNANTLWQQFQSDLKQAQQLFSGETITITGVVAGTTTSIFGTPNILISDAENQSVNIICVMPRTQFGQLSSFVTGQPVAMSGKFYSASNSDIYFKGCKRERI